MKVSIRLFLAGAVVYPIIAVVYGYMTQWKELVGFPALLLTGGLCGMIALYLWATDRRVGVQPEDRQHAEIADASGEYGMFAPYSWWPLPLAFGAALCFVGLAAAVWIFLVGAVISAVSLVGWVYEFYRGDYAH